MLRRFKDISSSSSSSEEDETPKPVKSQPKGCTPVTADKTATERRPALECPQDFVPCSDDRLSRLTLDKLTAPNTELWLIKAPVGFSPSSFSDKKVPLIGFNTVKTRVDGEKKIYNVLSSQKELPNTCVLALDQQCDLKLGSPFCGILNISEKCDTSNTSFVSNALPAIPAPQIPPCLKQRFIPFGSIASSKSPSLLQSNLDTNTHHVKKKRKKEKHYKQVKEEPDMVELVVKNIKVEENENMDLPELCRKKKKKDKKKYVE
ncbi:CD3e molecule, epsilon associated protein [Polypterus senegalus]